MTLPSSAALAVSAALLGASGVAYAADTPRQTFDHYVGCTSQVMALQIAGERQAAAKGGADKAQDLTKIIGVMRDKAIAAGKAVSVPPDRVSAQIDEGRDRLVNEMAHAAPPNSKQFGREIGLPALSCVLDEAGKKLAERKAEQAAHPAK